MRLPAQCLPHLLGEKRTSSLEVRFEYDRDDWKHVSRMEVLRDACAGRRVIHVGCVDHDVATIERKIEEGLWLHRRLCDCAERCFGVDIQEDGIRYMQERLGYADVEALDIASTESSRLSAGRWDCLLLPDVLEHIDDPVDFLTRLNRRFRANVSEIVITVPNALSRVNFKRARRNFERLNSDHRYWFTPYTLAKVVSRARFRVGTIRMCRHGAVSGRMWYRNYFLRRHPLMRNNIVLFAEFGE